MARRAAPILAAAAGLVLLLFIVLLAASDTQRTASLNFEIVGKVAPPIEGPTLAGDTFDLRDHRGSWVLVNFFASWCVGCRVEHPELVEFDARHDDVQLVAIMFGDTAQAASQFFADLGGDWPALIENTGPIAIDYGVTAVPETLLIAPTGRVVQKWIGAQGVTADQIEAVLALAKGEPGEPREPGPSNEEGDNGG